MTGPNWTCSANTCTRSDALAPTAAYPPITVTVNVSASAPASVTNQAAVSGGGAGASVTASDPTNISGTVVNRFSQIGIFRSVVLQTGAGFVLDSGGTSNWAPSDTAFLFGQPGDMPVAGDFFGNGVVEVGVFHCVTGNATCQWYIDANNNGQWDGVSGGDALWSFGIPGDLPVVGDWTGDGTSKIGIFRRPAAGSPQPCLWVLDAGNKRTYDPATAVYALYGLAGDLPIVSNWNGGAADQVGIFRGNGLSFAGIQGGLWVVDNLGLNVWVPADAQYSYGLPGDRPVVGNWNGSGTGRKKIGIFRPSGGYWVLNSSGTNSWSPSDPSASFGLNGDLPVVGFWTQSVSQAQ